ncbi:MAG: hypothetical protein ACK51V_01085, partial [bacterium]
PAPQESCDAKSGTWQFPPANNDFAAALATAVASIWRAHAIVSNDRRSVAQGGRCGAGVLAANPASKTAPRLRNPRQDRR